MVVENQTFIRPVLAVAGAKAGACDGAMANTPTGTNGVAATIILPAFNESAALPHVLAGLRALPDHREYEIVVVDDASRDETAEIARAHACIVLRHERNRGKGAAVRTGIGAARGRVVIVMDADNTYPVDAVPKMVALLAHCDFVRCPRRYTAEQMPLVNHIGNRLFDTLLGVVHGLEGRDHLSGLYGLQREALHALNLTSERFDLEVEIAIKARAHGLRSAFLPVDYRRRLGEKKLRVWRDGWHIFGRSLGLALRYNAITASVRQGRTACGAWLEHLACVVAPAPIYRDTRADRGSGYAE